MDEETVLKTAVADTHQEFDSPTFRLSPEQAVQAAVANARLSGLEVDESHKELLLQVARGELSICQAIAQVRENYRAY